MENNTTYNNELDETIIDYMAHANERPDEDTLEVSEPHVERTMSGSTWLVKDPEALKQEAQRLSETRLEVREDQQREQFMHDDFVDPHREQIQQDLATDQEIQNDVLREDELIDMAQLKDHFDQPQ